MPWSREIIVRLFTDFERELHHLGPRCAVELPHWRSSLAKLRLHRKTMLADLAEIEAGAKIAAHHHLAFHQAYFSVVAIELTLLAAPADSAIDRRLIEIVQERAADLIATLEHVVTDYEVGVRGVLVKRAQRRHEFDPAHAN